jgi:mannose-6-phosphate isomerase-like protein (cupin superfamily)
MLTGMDKPLFRRARDARTSRIKPADTNKFVLLVDPLADATPFISVVEIFDVGGRTPPNTHQAAHEMFYVLSGRGKAWCNGDSWDLEKGDTLVLPPGMDHVVENVGPDKLYCLTVMIPNEGFAELIHAGETMDLDAADRAVVSG